MIPEVKIMIGDVRAKLRELPANSVQCVVTSPPYWALRDYGTEPQVWGGLPDCVHDWQSAGEIHKGGDYGPSDAMPGRDRTAANAVRHIECGSSCAKCGAWLGELGLEPTPEMHVAHQVEVFREVRRVLKPDGVCWMNFGDSYAGSGQGAMSEKSSLMGNGHQGGGPKREQTETRRPSKGARVGSVHGEDGHTSYRRAPSGLKPKDLVGMPWRVAFALQADGWWLRQEIIWSKPNPMPESISDRCTKSHEHVFLLTKSGRYYWDAEANKEAVTGNAKPRGQGVNPKSTGVGWGYVDGEKPRTLKSVGGWEYGPGKHDKREFNRGERKPRPKQNESFSAAVGDLVDMRNRRTVWTIPTEAYSESHYATFPRDLVRPCILAGSRVGDVVLDPFGGSGTTGAVALEYGRNAILIDLNPANEALMRGRLAEHVGQGVFTME